MSGTATQWIPLVLGAGFGLGVFLLAAGARRAARPSTDRGFPGQAVAWLTGRRAPHAVAGTPSGPTGGLAGGIRGALQGVGPAGVPVRVAVVLVVGAVAGLATGWVIGAVLGAAAAWALPGMLLGAERGRVRGLARLDAVATWTESLTATLSSAAGLEQTIAATAPSAPGPIRGHVQQLAQALQGGAGLQAALAAFAADLDDPLADTVVAALLLASTHGGTRLGEPLRLLAAATREEAAARRRVERSRAKAATDARLIIGTTLVMGGGMLVFNRDFLTPYDSLGGQLILLLVGVGFGIGFRWLHRLGQQAEPERVLALHPHETVSAAAGAQQPGGPATPATSAVRQP